jgi:hypothetical protein
LSEHFQNNVKKINPDMDDGYYMVPHPDKNKLPKTCIDEE